MTEWLKQHWFIFSAILVAGTAWGQQQTKIANLEETIKKQAAIESKLDKFKEDSTAYREQALGQISEIKQQNARIEERLNLLLNLQKNQTRISNGSGALNSQSNPGIAANTR